MTITLIWPDGSITTGRTWREVENAIRSEQWVPSASRRAFRSEMRRRARIWSGDPIRTSIGPETSRQFVKSLALNGVVFLTIEEDTENA